MNPDSIMKNKKTSAAYANALNMPIVLSSSFKFDTVQDLEIAYSGSDDGFIYTRMANPNSDAVGRIVADMEKCEAGCAFSSGMAAITMTLLTLLEKGDHVVASSELYGETYMFLKYELHKRGIEATFVDLADANADIAHAFKQNTKVLYVETISNPLIGITDIRKAADLAHTAGCKLVIDNTFASPAVCNPALHGADIVLHSGTKYLCGHGDVIAGFVCSDAAIIKKISETGTLYGTTASPFDSWMMLRSLKTLELRMQRHSSNAMQLAEFFKSCPNIRKVNYPGLKDSKYHRLGSTQFNNGLFSGMMSIELDYSLEDTIKFMNKLQNINILPSLADVSTSVILPAMTSHRNLTAQERQKAGIQDGLVRISVGLEEIGELKQAFSDALEIS